MQVITREAQRVMPEIKTEGPETLPSTETQIAMLVISEETQRAVPAFSAAEQFYGSLKGNYSLDI